MEQASSPSANEREKRNGKEQKQARRSRPNRPGKTGHPQQFCSVLVGDSVHGILIYERQTSAIPSEAERT